MTDLWPAPTASTAVDAVVDVPGSKSMTARALVLAALASDVTDLHRAIGGADPGEELAEDTVGRREVHLDPVDS